jgi:hypothetical protein
VHGRGDYPVKQLHAGLFRRPRVLGLVALPASRNQVLPGVASAARAGKHVIESQLAPMELPAAVLAGVAWRYRPCQRKDEGSLTWRNLAKCSNEKSGILPKAPRQTFQTRPSTMEAPDRAE